MDDTSLAEYAQAAYGPGQINTTKQEKNQLDYLAKLDQSDSDFKKYLQGGGGFSSPGASPLHQAAGQAIGGLLSQAFGGSMLASI